MASLHTNQATSNVDDQATCMSKVDDQAMSNVDDQAMSNVDDQATCMSKVDDQAMSKVDDQALCTCTSDCNQDQITSTQVSKFTQTVDDHITTIFLMGKTGVGKKTIARHIFKDDAEKFPKVQSVASTTRQVEIMYEVVQLSMSEENKASKFQVLITDTNSLYGQKYGTFSNLNEAKMCSQISIIFFVLRYGCVTSEDCDPFNEMIQVLAQDDTLNVSDICYVIVTGCEGQDEVSRQKIVDMYKSDPMTQKLCSYVKDIKCIGFPDLDILIPDIAKLYAERIKEDELTIQEIIKSSEKKSVDLGAALSKFKPVDSHKPTSLNNCSIL